MKCINPRCERSARTRGLCNACHAEACRLVSTGKITYDELQVAGKILPKDGDRGDAQQARHRLSWLMEGARTPPPEKRHITFQEAIAMVRKQEFTPVFVDDAGYGLSVQSDVVAKWLEDLIETGSKVKAGINDDEGEPMLVIGAGIGDVVIRNPPDPIMGRLPVPPPAP